MIPGGIEWMSYDYGLDPVSTVEVVQIEKIEIVYDTLAQTVNIRQLAEGSKMINYTIVDTSGKILGKGNLEKIETSLSLVDIPFGIYVISVQDSGRIIKSTKIMHKP